VIVVDASALVPALVEDSARGARARDVLAADPRWAAPHHLLIEVVSTLRGLVLRGRLDPSLAADAARDATRLVLDELDLRVLVPRIWQLRSNLTAYDAAYVAVAETLACPLVTGDARISRAAGVRCPVLVVS